MGECQACKIGLKIGNSSWCQDCQKFLARIRYRHLRDAKAGIKLFNPVAVYHEFWSHFSDKKTYSRT